jgi:hypothetical protein
MDRWMARQSPADLHSAITALSELDAVLSGADPMRLALDGYFGFALAARCLVTGSAADRDEAIERLRRVASWPQAPADFDASRLLLGQLLASRLQASSPGQGGPPGADGPSEARLLADLDEAVEALAVAAESGKVAPAQRAEARALRAHLTPLRALGRSWAARKAGELADVTELDAALRDTPAGHPSRDELALETGLVHGFLAVRDSPGQHAAQARRCLTGVLERKSPGDTQRGLALMLLLFLMLSEAQAGPGPMRAGPILGLAEESAADPALDRDVASVLHILAGMAHRAHAGAGPARSRGAYQDAMSHFNRAKDLAPELESVRSLLLGVVAGSLALRSAGSAALDVHDAAAVYSRQFSQVLDSGNLLAGEARASGLRGLAQVTHPSIYPALLAGDRLASAFLTASLADVDAALEQLAQHLARIPPDNQFRCLILISLGSGWRMRAALSGDRRDVIRGLRMVVSGYEQAGRSPRIAAISAEHGWRLRAVYPAAELAWLTGDLQAMTTAIKRICEIGDEPGMTGAERAGWSWQYGMTLIRRQLLTGDRRDLDDGIARLEDAARADDPSGAAPESALLQNLATAYWSRGDRDRGDQLRAIDTGLLALRQRSAEVLLQAGAERALQVARWQEQPYVAPLVGWCLAEGQLRQAVAAIEQGRALVLHTTTVATDVPGLLQAAGHGELAARWQHEARQAHPMPWDTPLTAPGIDALLPPGPGQPIQVPAQVRLEVLQALREAPGAAALLAPPDIGELAAALRRARADAFAYLIPSSGGSGGCALLLSAGGELDRISLPGLAEEELEPYERAYLRASEADWDPATRSQWQRSLNELCGWAWDAAAGPVLDYVTRHYAPGQPGRVPRLVLIPTGRLGIVPWHAARTTGPDGRPRYSLEDAVFSYAASARQFEQASRRPRRPPAESPVLVSNPTGDLPMAQDEVTEIHRRWYPGAVYLGRPPEIATGLATSGELLSRLPGGGAGRASLLHCGCHARVAASLAASHLVLADGQRLAVAEIVAQAQRLERGAGPAPGFLAVLSACTSDLAHVDHDEALTLSSALLAAGATGVVGARWPTQDRVTAPLMVMFHHYLNRDPGQPAQALRAAQLWMLDRSRAVFGDLPAGLAAAARAPRLAEAHAWAAFTYQGA